MAAQYPRVWVTTAEFHTYLVKTPDRQNLYSEGWIIHRGKRMAVARAEVRREDGALVAYGTGTFIVLEHLKFDLEEAKKRLSELRSF